MKSISKSERRVIMVCASLLVTAQAALAGPMSTNPSTWAQNCIIRNQVNGDAAMNLASTGPAAEYEQVVVQPSADDAELGQQWDLAPDSTNPSLYYLVSAAGPTGSNALCMTVHSAASSVPYLDYCSYGSTLSEFRIGLAYTGTRYIYQLISFQSYLNSQNYGLEPLNHVVTAGNPVILSPLDSSNLNGTDPINITHIDETWGVQNCVDSDGNAVAFGSGWTINGSSTGY